MCEQFTLPRLRGPFVGRRGEERLALKCLANDTVEAETLFDIQIKPIETIKSREINAEDVESKQGYSEWIGRPALVLTCSCEYMMETKLSSRPMPSTTKNNHKYYYNHSLRQPTINNSTRMRIS